MAISMQKFSKRRSVLRIVGGLRMTTSIRTFTSPEATCLALAEDLACRAQKHALNIALSGGRTPQLLFQTMANQFDPTTWHSLSFFWGDERLVPYDDSESNYGHFANLLIKPGIISPNQVFPIPTQEKNVEQNLIALKRLLSTRLPLVDGFPIFDLVILGVGNDGHVASIFPDHLDSFKSGEMAEIAFHPQTGQERLTLTGSTLNHAKEIIFLCTGIDKKTILTQIIQKQSSDLPATHLVATNRPVTWFIDQKI